MMKVTTTKRARKEGAREVGEVQEWGARKLSSGYTVQKRTTPYRGLRQLFSILLVLLCMSPHFIMTAAGTSTNHNNFAKIALSYSTTVHCHPSDRSICVGYTSSYGPFPLSICDAQGFNCDMMFHDGMAGYGWTYVFVNGLRQDEDLSAADLDDYATGLVVDVRLDDDGVNCDVAVGNTTCHTCTPCSVAAVSADCTNLPGGRTVQCEALGPVFYPLRLPNGAIPPPAVTVGAVVTTTTETMRGGESFEGDLAGTTAAAPKEMTDEMHGEVPTSASTPSLVYLASVTVAVVLATLC